ncbi:hypothetical protein [Flavobacterium algicola]|uniref:hypothetical protein n=1 Tax=Flavobacterium algicola TaxID=556529 RepID=UPI001EFD78C6|nr:hypothetical protein [Flavobacterium algicola]MCG9792515.1 hypothetical protein [Flavobacterium algicola]
MNKITISLFSFLALISCKNKSTAEENIKREKYTIDSLKIMDRVKERSEKLLEKTRKDFYLDTTGVSKSPIKVTNSRLIKKDYSNYKDIELTFVNVSEKKIQAVRFEWYGENSFKEPAEMGSYSLLGEGGGFTDEIINPGRTRKSQWSISSVDAKRVIAARAYEVAFTDGTTWKLRND